MDEYRGRYEAYGRREQSAQEPHAHHHRQEEAPVPHLEPAPSKGLLSSFGIGGGVLDDYLPILLILLGAVGVYLWLDRQEGGLGGLLGGFLK